MFASTVTLVGTAMRAEQSRHIQSTMQTNKLTDLLRKGEREGIRDVRRKGVQPVEIIYLYTKPQEGIKGQIPSCINEEKFPQGKDVYLFEVGMRLSNRCSANKARP